MKADNLFVGSTSAKRSPPDKMKHLARNILNGGRMVRRHQRLEVRKVRHQLGEPCQG